MVRQSSRGRGLVALGGVLVRRGAAAKVALGLGGACVLGFSALALLFARRGRAESLPGVPLLASSALAFGIGVLIAFAGSTRAFRRDADEGIETLMRLRGVGVGGYLWARLAGLAVTLGWVVAGGSAVVGLIATLGARGQLAALRTGQATLAATAFGIAFAVTLAPVAMATLGGRSRGGGYLALGAVLVVPEILAPTLTHLLTPRWVEVCSIPGALIVLRDALSPGTVDLPALGRALAILFIVVIASVVAIRAELTRSHRSPAP
jgi:hypothetical protein